VEWLKVLALRSNPNTTKKKKVGAGRMFTEEIQVQGQSRLLISRTISFNFLKKPEE
jgi:hypothetical protein